ncbi:MAG: ABC transporter ATP-binding protein [Actinomycetes bacterium]
MPADSAGMMSRSRGLVRAGAAACGTWSLVQLLIVQLLMAATEGVGLILVVPVVQAVQGDASVSIPGTSITISAAAALIGVALAVILRAGLTVVSATQSNSVRLRTVDFLRLRALDALLHAQWSYLARQRRSHLVQTLTTEISRTGAAIDQLSQAFVGALVLAVTAVIAIVIAPWLGLAAIVAVALVGLASVGNIRRASQLGQALSVRIRSFGALVTDSLAAARLVRAHDAADVWMTAMEREAALGRAVQSRYVLTSSSVRAAVSVAAIVGVVVLILLGRVAGLEGSVLIALIIVLSRLLSGTQGLVQKLQTLANFAPALDHVEQITREARSHREEPAAGVRATTEDLTAPLVVLSDVTVRYDDDERCALATVSLSLPHGAFVAVVGPSGAGKSTLLDVILGLRRPTSGEVLVDGRPLADDVLGWRARTAYVPQDVVLIPGSVRDNLTWSLAPGIAVTDEQIWRALRIADLAAVVAALPDGLETVLGDEARFSGGERQRMSLARALLREPELLVLDEATSALDTDTETRILDELRQRGGSILLVTHRLNVADRADQVVRLEEGRVVGNS